MTYINGIRYYPNSGSVRAANFTCDVYTNDSLQEVCFPTVYTMKENFSNIFNPIYFRDQTCEVFDMRFVGRVIHKFNFHDHFVRFSYVHGLPCDG